MIHAQALTEPHLLTAELFAASAVATKLTNHGRRWQVTYGERFSAFSDEATAEAAVVDVHRATVNNALYFHLPDVSVPMANKPALPPAEVLAQYPDVVARFPELGLSAGAQGCLAL
jgi:hypothetical protein